MNETLSSTLKRLRLSGLAETLEGKVGELYTVGDCGTIGNAMKAIESAYNVAMRI